MEVCKKNIKPEDLRETIQDAWSEICSPVTANLVDSMTHHLQVVINENGMHTN